MKDTNARPENPQSPDDRALSAIFDEYAPIIYQYVMRFCHDPEQADRLVGDVFAQLLEKLALRKRPASDARVYVYRIAYDTIARHLHDSGQNPPAFIASIPSREEEAVIRAAAASALDKRLT